MNRRNNVARTLVTLGAIVLIAAALLHLSDYPKDLSAVSASNLRAPLKGGVRALYFSFGWDSIVIATLMLISTFTATNEPVRRWPSEMRGEVGSYRGASECAMAGAPARPQTPPRRSLDTVFLARTTGSEG